MPESNDVDVFVSYAHNDRERVRPIVERLKAEGFSVWWDTEIQIGSRWRAVISDRLAHAKSVCVVWSTTSTERDFVREEAQGALARGILVPVLLDRTTPPLGFGEVQFASLANPATADAEMARIISRIRLCLRLASVLRWGKRLKTGLRQPAMGRRRLTTFSKAFGLAQTS